MERVSVAGLLVVACGSLSAQWLNYPTPGIPRNPDGSPNLAAPAPKTADGKPDLSGFWSTEHLTNNCVQPRCPDLGDIGVSREYMALGSGIQGGLPYQPSTAQLVKKRIAENGKDDPGIACLPIGFLRVNTDLFYRKIIQVPGLLLILSERNASYRQIFTDGRPLPSDPNPSWNGYSVGTWNGETLVVETNGFRDGEWLDRSGSPLTEGARVIERFRRLDFGHLEVEMTVDDPQSYTRPWTVKVPLHNMPDTELLDYICLENEKDIAHFVGN